MIDSHTIEKIIDLVISYLPKLALALITLVAGLWLIKYFIRFIVRVMKTKDVDESLIPFLSTLSRIILTILLLISVMGMIGIEMTSFIALIGAAGISLGMALSGALQHFAGGVLLLVYKPFRVGDFIEAQNNKGTVKEIGIFSTVINTIDNKTVFMPNGPLSSGTIINYTSEEKRRAEVIFSISYTDDIDKAKKIIRDVIEKEPGILNDPPPLVAVSELGASSVNIMVRAWVATDDFLDMNFYMLETVKKEFDKQGITIPFPQMDVNLKKE